MDHAPEKVHTQRQNDDKLREELSLEDISLWINHEKEALSKLCLENGIGFIALNESKTKTQELVELIRSLSCKYHQPVFHDEMV